MHLSPTLALFDAGISLVTYTFGIVYGIFALGIAVFLEARVITDALDPGQTGITFYTG